MNSIFGVGRRILRLRVTTHLPSALFGPGIAGASYYADPATLFSDAGVTPAGLGEAVRQINDRAGTGINGGQSTLANRPLRGRGPRDLRNMLRGTVDLASTAWTAFNCAVTPGGGGFKIVPSAGSRIPATGAYALSVVPAPPGPPHVYSVEMKAGELPIGILTVADRVNVYGGVAVDLTTGTIVETGGANAGSITEASCTPVSGDPGWYRVSFVHDGGGAFDASNGLAISGAPAGLERYLLYVATSATYDGASGVFARKPQREAGAVLTAYQDVDVTGCVITEAGVDSGFSFLRFDSNDVIQTTFPSGLTGQILIAGRDGSWLNSVALTAGQALSVGSDPLRGNAAETWTGGPYQGRRAIGDVIGWTAREGVFSTADLGRLLRDYGRKGASGLLAPVGTNLAPNPNFDTDSGWTKSGPGVTWSGGQYTIADVAGADSYISAQMSDVQPGRSYLVEVAITATSATGSGFRARIGGGAGQATDGDHFAPPTPFTGLWQFVLVARRPNPWVTFLASATNLGVTISSVSIRELVAGALP